MKSRHERELVHEERRHKFQHTLARRFWTFAKSIGKRWPIWASGIKRSLRICTVGLHRENAVQMLGQALLDLGGEALWPQR